MPALHKNDAGLQGNGGCHPLNIQRLFLFHLRMSRIWRTELRISGLPEVPSQFLLTSGKIP